MAQITLGNKKTINTLKVNIGKESYNIPLTGSLTLAELRAFQKGDDDGFTFFGKYIPDEVMDSLTMDDFKRLTEAWKKASEAENGVALGE